MVHGLGLCRTPANDLPAASATLQHPPPFHRGMAAGNSAYPTDLSVSGGNVSVPMEAHDPGNAGRAQARSEHEVTAQQPQQQQVGVLWVRSCMEQFSCLA